MMAGAETLTPFAGFNCKAIVNASRLSQKFTATGRELQGVAR